MHEDKMTQISLLKTLAAEIKELTGAETAVIALTEENGTMISYAASVGKHAEWLQGRRGPAAGSGLCDTTLEAGGSVLVCQTNGDKRVRQDHVKALGIETALATPVFYDGQAIAVLMAMNREDGNAFSEQQEKALNNYASTKAALIWEAAKA